MNLEPADENIRGLLTKSIAELGHAPSEENLAAAAGISQVELQVRLQKLADAHSLLLHPGTTKPWVVHPFALSPGSCWVQTAKKGYWANCLYCALGIAAVLKTNARITTRLGGESETVWFEIEKNTVSPPELLFHLSTPPIRWWDNVIFACSTFQPFRNEQDIDTWCKIHDLAKGAILSLPQLNRFAQDWYGDYIDKPWRKRTKSDIVEIFERNNLLGDFWRI